MFASAEGQVPLSLFMKIMHNIYPFQPLSFGQKRPDNRDWFVNVYKINICKYELPCVNV